MMHTARRSTRGFRNIALRGVLGDTTCDSDGNCYDTSSGDYVGNSSTPTDPYSAVEGPYTLTTGTPADVMTGPSVSLNNPALQIDSSTPTSSSSSSAANIFSTIANDFTSLLSPVVKAATTQKPYYITNAQGQQVLYNPATGTTVSGLGSISPTVLIGGGVLLLVLMMSKK